MVAQLMAAAAVDQDIAEIKQAEAEYHAAIDQEIIHRAMQWSELSDCVDPEHAVLLFIAPIFYRHLFYRQTATAKWIAAHIDKTVTLLTST